MNKVIAFKNALLYFVLLVIVIFGGWQILRNSFDMMPLVSVTFLGAASFASSYFFASLRFKPIQIKLVLKQVAPISLILLFLMAFMAGII